MFYYYSTDNINHVSPSGIDSTLHVHIKSKSDGTKTIIMTKTPIAAEAVNPKTKYEAQAILNLWIEIENENAPIDPETGSPFLQKQIDLNMFEAKDGQLDWHLHKS